MSIGTELRELGIEIRTGLHTGEIEPSDDVVGGIAVHIGARVAATSEPGEILVSIGKDRRRGSGIRF